MARSRLAVVVVWDGLRPDTPSPELTPNLWALRERGVWFADSRAVFPSETRCNVATMVTGCQPGTHGLVANQFYAPELDARRVLNAGDHARLLRLHEVSGGNLLMVPSLGEVLTGAGGTVVVASAGSSGSAHLWNHRAAEGMGLVVNWLMTQPEGLQPEIVKAFGKAPDKAIPNNACCDWATEVFLEALLPTALARRPAVATLWLSEPDVSQHATGLATPEVLAGLRGNDERLGRALRRLAELGLGVEEQDGANLVLLSDHGFSTIEVAPETADSVGEVTGGTVCSYIGVWNCPAERRVEVARHLMHQNWVGPLFVRGDLPEGALPLSAANLDSPRAADVAFSYNWSEATNDRGIRGSAAGHSGPYLANHCTLSPYDMRNTMLACGPGFKGGCVSDIASGNVDLAPTLLHLLDVEAPTVWEGRVLREALAGVSQRPAVERETLGARADLGDCLYEQALEVSSVEGVRYLDRGTVWRHKGG